MLSFLFQYMFSCCDPVEPFLSHFCLHLRDRIPAYLEGLTWSLHRESDIAFSFCFARRNGHLSWVCGPYISLQWDTSIVAWQVRKKIHLVISFSSEFVRDLCGWPSIFISSNITRSCSEVWRSLWEQASGLPSEPLAALLCPPTGSVAFTFTLLYSMLRAGFYLRFWVRCHKISYSECEFF